MRVHILGIGGTFMGGLAQIARAMGHEVSGQDNPLYPPMSTQLAEVGIAVRAMDDLSFVREVPDVVVVGNVMRRGMVAVEALLDAGLSYVSGPQWLAEQALAGKWVLAVSGTHGKTTTSSLLAWILEYAGLAPGFLIGGVPANFGVSARWSAQSPFFVVEADEYDSAFFDKRAKLVHYHPRTWILNNLEFDHADIYDDLAQIQRQVHHGVRTVPSSGLLVVPEGDEGVAGALALGCWTPQETQGASAGAQWQYRLLQSDASKFEVWYAGECVGGVHWGMMGEFNLRNALSAVAAARHAGVPPSLACEALSQFAGVARRLTLLAEQGQVCVYEDFAHHPTAIAATLSGLRARYAQQRLLVVLEPRSNSMRMGAFTDRLAGSLQQADRVFLYRDPAWGWAIDAQAFVPPVQEVGSYDALLRAVQGQVQPGDVLVCMSNGGFGGVPAQLADWVRQGMPPGGAV